MLIRLAAVALLSGVPAAVHAAAETPPSAAPSEAAAQPEKPKKICRMETRTGSVMPKRVCRTPEQVEADQAAAHAALDDVERNRGSQ
jgi:hypothetical protein